MSFIQSNPLTASLMISLWVNIFFFIFAASFTTDISYSLSFFLLTLSLPFFNSSLRSWEQLLAAGAAVFVVGLIIEAVSAIQKFRYRTSTNLLFPGLVKEKP